MARGDERFARVEARVFGGVQGVGFRAWTRQIAQERGLTGFVKNESDGSVFAVAEGTQSQLQEFINCLEGGPESGLVAKVKVNWSSRSGGFKAFSVCL